MVSHFPGGSPSPWGWDEVDLALSSLGPAGFGGASSRCLTAGMDVDTRLATVTNRKVNVGLQYQDRMIIKNQRFVSEKRMEDSRQWWPFISRWAEDHL